MIYSQESDPISTQLLGDAANSESSSLSKRLGVVTLHHMHPHSINYTHCPTPAAKKTGCQCYVSLNIKDSSLCQLVEEHINSLYESDPHSFFFH